MNDQYAIETRDLCREFKKDRKTKFTALDRINIKIEQGGIFGFLGPNGAGKTTLIKILVTLLYPSTGSAFIQGLDVVRDAAKVRPLINIVSGGETSGYGILNVRENIWMFSQFYGIPSKVAKQRIDEYLELFEMTGDAATKINKLSTGMRQKMNIIRGLITEPQILFLDEPTLGLDVHIAREIRNYLSVWIKQRGDRTIFLTTHYMAEAEQLCNRLAIIDRGRIVADDSPTALRAKLSDGSRFRINVAPVPGDLHWLENVVAVDGVKRRRELDGLLEVGFRLHDETRIGDVFEAAQAQGLRIVGVDKRQPDLEELFLQIVGRQLDDDE
ncbi:MAG: ABC transporter ATP-binding protein [Candidatus Alcyoniella australis]|nr:ABC transporter ATP-binding protein [Candidatus Alcyoniella australis]